MARLAGERLKMAAGRGEMSGADVVTTLAALGGLGGLTVTGLASLIDYFSGDARIDNSGEYLANSVITTIPLGTAAAGAGLVAARDPVARGLAGVVLDTAAARQAGQDYGADAVLTMLSQGEAPRPSTEGVEAAANRVKTQSQRLAEQLRQRIATTPKLATMDPGKAAELLLQRSGRGLVRGAGLGALAGSVPAVMLMMDRPAEQSRKEA